MNPANLGYLAVIVLVVVAWVLLDPVHRARRAERKTLRRERRAVRRAEAVVAAAEAQARQEVFDVLARHHRTQRRLVMAGHDPRLAGPVRLPGETFVPQQRQAGSGTGSQPSEVGRTQETP